MSGLDLDTSRTVAEAAPLEEMPVGVPSYRDVMARAERAEAALAALLASPAERCAAPPPVPSHASDAALRPVRVLLEHASSCGNTAACLRNLAASDREVAAAMARLEGRSVAYYHCAEEFGNDFAIVRTALSDLLAALPRCRECVEPATTYYEHDDRYCDGHATYGDGSRYDWATAVRRARALMGVES